MRFFGHAAFHREDCTRFYLDLQSALNNAPETAYTLRYGKLGHHLVRFGGPGTSQPPPPVAVTVQGRGQAQGLWKA